MRNGTILIIDDEEDLCYLLKGYFTSRNFNVEIAHSLRDGWQKLAGVLPDHLFLDNNLPDGDGWLAASDILAKYPKVQLNLISAFHPSIPPLPAYANCQVIEKPINLSHLERILTESEELTQP